MLHQADYVVIVFYFLFMTLIGWVFKRFIKNTSDYFRGGGEMLWWICGAGAFMVSFSAVTFTGMAGKAYSDGPIVLAIFVGNAIGFLVNYFWFAATSRQTRAVTAMEVVRARFGRVNELFFTWLQIPVGTFYAGLWLVGLAKFVAAGFDWDVNATILVTGFVVLFMALLGGSWSVMAGDFVQLLVLMPVTIIVAILSLIAIGGPGQMVAKTPSHFWHWGEVASWWHILPWVVLTLVQKLISTNSMNDCSRYLSVKDSTNARKAALLGFALFMIGPVLWFIPPMVARVMYPDLTQVFKGMNHPEEAAYFAMAVNLLPAGMTGLLISGIFGATMSSMDGGLNKNAGFFVKNFYQPYLKPHATEHELMFISKITTTVLGLLVIAAAWTVAQQPNLTIFEAMTWFGSLVGVPTSVPLVLGMIFRKAPGWAGWSTALVGMICSVVVANVFSAEDMTRMFGWQLNKREASDWVFTSGTLINVTVPVAWFFFTGWIGWDHKPQRVTFGPEPKTMAEVNQLPERQRIEALFKLMKKPVDYHSEEGGPGSDNRQAKIMGLLCLIYGAFVTLLIVLPKDWTGRISVIFCGGTMLLIGWGLWRAGTKGSRAAHV